MVYSFRRAVWLVKEQAMSELIKDGHRWVLRLDKAEKDT